jgi:hypothetical protein
MSGAIREVTVADTEQETETLLLDDGCDEMDEEEDEEEDCDRNWNPWFKKVWP